MWIWGKPILQNEFKDHEFTQRNPISKQQNRMWILSIQKNWIITFLPYQLHHISPGHLHILLSLLDINRLFFSKVCTWSQRIEKTDLYHNALLDGVPNHISHILTLLITQFMDLHGFWILWIVQWCCDKFNWSCVNKIIAIYLSSYIGGGAYSSKQHTSVFRLVTDICQAIYWYLNHQCMYFSNRKQILKFNCDVTTITVLLFTLQ